MISPISVYLAMAMTTNGAAGETQRVMLDALAGRASLETLDTSAAYWMNRLSTREKETVLSIVNSIWVHQDYRVTSSFLQANADFFDASAKSLDFSRLDAARHINDWVKKMTNGKIDAIIDRTSGDMPMILVNASYFKSVWEQSFDKSLTHDRMFHATTGDVLTPFMHTTREMGMLRFTGAQGVVLPYKTPRYRFFALLPDEGSDIRTWLAHQDPLALYLSILQSQASLDEVDLRLPTFTATYEDSLASDLMGMGMGIAFHPDSADFSGMSEMGTKDLFIGDVLHKTFIQVDEEGTEAAAATAVVMKATAFMPREIVRIVFDRPFFYGIIDNETGLPLFIGILDKPEAPSGK